ncbi:MAG: cell division protein ZapE [Enterobacteriaceae bacterium]
MTLLTPLTAYQQALQQHNYQSDLAQYQAIVQLEELYQRFLARHRAGLKADRQHKGWGRWFKRNNTPEPLPGLYLWGGVGRGKTWLMDLFYQSLPGKRKIRLHFHRFMQRVHDMLTERQGEKNPLEGIADDFAVRADILCFDEFFVTDIADAMLLGELLKLLFARGITLVATSNIAPEQLYHNGLQRARFLPAIAAIEEHCQVLNVDAGIDYRRQTLTEQEIFLTGADRETKIAELFDRVVGHPGEGGQTIRLNHHPLTILNRAEGVLAIEFSELCDKPRSARDYIVLSDQYHTVFVHNMYPMGENHEDCARRFVALIDEFYERRVKLIISSAVEPAGLYDGERTRFEFERCLSRLQEMQSQQYLQQHHRA